MSWRDSLRPASFRGAPFKVDTSSRAGGRRGQTYEFPKSDSVKDEDLGRRAHRFAITGWVIGADYQIDADALEAALNAEGAGLLIHPIMGEADCRCETYTRSERRVEGGMATFDLTFVEAPLTDAGQPSEDTQAAVRAAAEASSKETAASIDRAIALEGKAPQASYRPGGV